jgi:KaiC
LTGAVGTGRTVMARQFVIAVIRDYRQNGVLVTFEDAPADLTIKMRGTFHDKGIREYLMEGRGTHLLAPLCGVHGFLSGTPTYTFDEERARLGACSMHPEQLDRRFRRSAEVV